MVSSLDSPPSHEQPIRIGYVKYLNTLPLIDGLDQVRGVELVPAVPSRLVDLLADAHVDVALVSLVDVAKSAIPLALLPVGMIGCDGPTLTVRLFSAVAPERITTVHGDTDSHTSVILAQVVLDALYGVRPKMIDFDARERVEVAASKITQWPETLLLIGDKVVTDCPPAERYPYQLDLGEAWHRATGLPFVYAMWMCRAADAAPSSSRAPAVATAMALLDRQRRRNIMRLGWIIEQFATERRWPEDLARRYVTEYLRYSVGPRERIAVQSFIDAASALGLCPPVTATFVEMELPAGRPLAPTPS